MEKHTELLDLFIEAQEHQEKAQVRVNNMAAKKIDICEKLGMVMTDTQRKELPIEFVYVKGTKTYLVNIMIHGCAPDNEPTITMKEWDNLIVK